MGLFCKSWETKRIFQFWCQSYLLSTKRFDCKFVYYNYYCLYYYTHLLWQIIIVLVSPVLVLQIFLFLDFQIWWDFSENHEKKMYAEFVAYLNSFLSIKCNINTIFLWRKIRSLIWVYYFILLFLIDNTAIYHTYSEFVLNNKFWYLSISVLTIISSKIILIHSVICFSYGRISTFNVLSYVNE